MSYPHLNNDFEGRLSDDCSLGTVVDFLQRELAWMLMDRRYEALEDILLEELEDAEDLRAAVLVNSNRFSSQSLNYILEEIDRLVDAYHRSESWS